MIKRSQWSSLRVSQHRKFNLWALYPNTQSKATSQVFTQIYQYQAHKIKFLMIISNELVGVDITLNYSSRLGYNAMGFDTSTVYSGL
jgi:hypothetical protein